MENLYQIPHIKDNIDKATAKAIKSFHKLVFEQDGDRKNRQRLRSFTGFDFTFNSDEYEAKINYVNRALIGGELILICDILNLDISGNTPELIKRICQHLIDINLLAATHDDEDDENIEDEEDEQNDDYGKDDSDVRPPENGNSDTIRGNDRLSNNLPSCSGTKPKFLLSFRDIEDSIRPFSGEDNYSVINFLTEFEENKVLMQWNDLETFIFAKKSLRGLAKAFIQSERRAFELLKAAVTREPTLAIYKQDLDTELHTDASMDGYGAVLLQRSPDDDKLHPVYFMSRKTTEAEKKYSSYELEVLAIVQALKKFRIYLLGIRFKIITDCSAFQKTVYKKDIPPRIARWALLLEEYNYLIDHRKATRIKHVDALSRYPIMNVVAETKSSTLPRLKSEQAKDDTTAAIKEILRDKPYDDPTKWYKNVDAVQQALNSTYQRSIATTPFELLFGTKMRKNTNVGVKELLEEEMIKDFENDREDLRKEAKRQIKKVQEENKKCYDAKRRTPSRYRVNDLVAIKRTQFGGGQKLKPKYLGPYRVIKVKFGDSYDVTKDGTCQGPLRTSTTAEYMKPWINASSSGSDE